MIVRSYLKRKKVLILYTTIFSICILAILIILFGKVYIHNNLIQIIQNKIENRCLLISSDNYDSYETLEKNLVKTHISKVYNYINSSYASSNELKMSLLTIGIPELIPHIELGDSLTENSINSVIIPKYIRTDKTIIDTSDLLEKNIKFSINSYNKNIDYSAKIVGIYNNQDNMSDVDPVYISINDVKFFNFDSINKQLIIIVDEENNMSDVKKQLIENGYHYNLYDDTTYKELNSYKTLYNMINFYEWCFIIFVGVIVFIFLICLLSDQKYDIALKKAIGYDNIYILKTLLIEIISYLSLIYICCLIPLVILLKICSINLPHIYIIQSLISLYFLIIFFIFIICLFLLRKIKKIQIIDLLRD